MCRVDAGCMCRDVKFCVFRTLAVCVGIWVGMGAHMECTYGHIPWKHFAYARPNTSFPSSQALLLSDPTVTHPLTPPDPP